MHVGISSLFRACCSVHPVPSHAPCSHCIHTATLLGSCSMGQRPALCRAHTPVLCHTYHACCRRCRRTVQTGCTRSAWMHACGCAVGRRCADGRPLPPTRAAWVPRVPYWSPWWWARHAAVGKAGPAWRRCEGSLPETPETAGRATVLVAGSWYLAGAQDELCVAGLRGGGCGHFAANSDEFVGRDSATLLWVCGLPC